MRNSIAKGLNLYCREPRLFVKSRHRLMHIAADEDARPVVADLERPCSYSIVVYIHNLLGKVMAYTGDHHVGCWGLREVGVRRLASRARGTSTIAKARRWRPRRRSERIMRASLKTGADIGAAKLIGKLVAERAAAAGMKDVVFDRVAASITGASRHWRTLRAKVG